MNDFFKLIWEYVLQFLGLFLKNWDAIPPETMRLLREFLAKLGALIGFTTPQWIIDFICAFIAIVAIIAVFMIMFALMSVFERKILARAQNRYGPNRVGPWGLFQPVADGIKMLTKEDLVPRAADQVVHLLAPVMMVAPALMLPAILPFGRGMTAINLSSGILYFFALSAGTELAVFMAGWSSNNKYSVIGAMRAVAQMISYELPLVMAAIVAAFAAGTLSPDGIVQAQSGYTAGFLPNWYICTPWGFAAGVLFYIGALAESNRCPFDLPEGESELVAGHLTEYSGFKYAIFFMAEYVGMFAIVGMFVTLFLGGYNAPFPFLEWIPSYCWFFLKVAAIAFSFVWVRATLPRMRIDHMMQFAWKFMLPMSFAALLALAAWHYAGRNALGWGLSAVLVAAPYLLLGRFCFGNRHSPTNRRYDFSE
ncbi:MAG: NADH-quinone oxidoreductase subunit NuoH [Chthoniobacteraceae bacterium]